MVLFADPATQCGTGPWAGWATLAMLGVLIYCIGIPAGALWLTSKYAGVPHMRANVSLLLTSYTPECWYYESVDLFRKFVLTSVVLVVSPNTRPQLWFGLVTSIFFAVLTLRLAPYRDSTPGLLQTAAQLQIVFSYVCAGVLFFRSPQVYGPEAWSSSESANGWGVLLVIANSLCFGMLVVTLFLAGRAQQRALGGSRLTAADGSALSIVPPASGRSGYHIFLSHQWKYGQDQVGTIKSMLRLMLPEVRTFLDVDNLTDISMLEQHIGESDMVLVMLTAGYIGSANCRRELREALRRRKPIVLVRESDTNHGALTLGAFREEVRMLPVKEDRVAAEALVALLEGGTALEWHREKHLKHATLAMITQRLVEHQHARRNPGGNKGGSATLDWMHADTPPEVVVSIDGELPNRRLPTVPAFRFSSLYIEVGVASSAVHRGGSLHASLMHSLEGAGATVSSARTSFAAPRGGLADVALGARAPATEEPPADDDGGGTGSRRWPTAFRATRRSMRGLTSDNSVASFTAVHQIIVLCPEVLEAGPLLDELVTNLRDDPQLLHQPTTVRLYSTVVPFDHYLTHCPPKLRALGLFDAMYGKWPEAAYLQQAVARLLVNQAVVGTPADAGDPGAVLSMATIINLARERGPRAAAAGMGTVSSMARAKGPLMAEMTAKAAARGKAGWRYAVRRMRRGGPSLIDDEDGRRMLAYDETGRVLVHEEIGCARGELLHGVLDGGGEMASAAPGSTKRPSMKLASAKPGSAKPGSAKPGSAKLGSAKHPVTVAVIQSATQTALEELGTRVTLKALREHMEGQLGTSLVAWKADIKMAAGAFISEHARA